MLGPEAQRAALLRWAEVRGLQLVAVHEDRGVSGAAPLRYPTPRSAGLTARPLARRLSYQRLRITRTFSRL